MRSSIAALLFFFFMLPNAFACSCKPITLQNSAKNADSVFLATLQEAKVVPGGDIEGKFLVYKTLKGSPSGEPMTLRTSPDDGSCGVKMMVAERYVIFMTRGSDGINACDGSEVLGHFGPVSRWAENEVIAEVEKAAHKTRRQR